MGAAALLGVAVGLARRVSPESAAGVVDDALDLRDRLRSAIELASTPGGEDETFVALSVAESERVAPGARATRAIPLRWEWTWGACAATLALAVTLAVALPRREAGVGGAGIERVTLAQREQAADSLAQAAQLVREIAVEETALDDAGSDELDAIESLEAELSEGRGDPEEALTESADALERLADEMERRAEQQELERDEFERLAQDLDTGSADPDVQRLADAVRSADLEQAREAARDLMSASDLATPEQRERLARDLETLARQLEDRATPEDASTETPTGEPPSDPAPEEDGVTPPPGQDPMYEPPDPATRPESGEHAPDQPPANPQTDQPETQPESETSPDEQIPPADPIREQAQRRESARDQAQRDARDIAQALREAAERTRQGEQSQQTPEQQPAQQQEQQPGQQPDQQPAQDDPRAPDSQTPRDAGEQRPQPGERQEPNPSPEPGGEQDDPADNQTPAPTDEPPPGDTAPEGQTPDTQQPDTSQPDAQQPGDPGQADPEQPAPTDDPAGGEPGEQETPAGEDGTQPPDQSAPGREPAPGQGERQDSPEPGDARPGPSRTPGEDPAPGGGRPTLDEQFRRLSERHAAPPRQRENAQRLRDRARELLGDAPEPADRPEGGAGADDPGRRIPPGASGTPADNETFDARPPEGEAPEDVREQVVADWYSDERMQRDPAARRAASQRLRDAASSAERAIEQQTVPRRRRDLIRRLNERYLRRADELPGAPAPLGTDADGGDG